MYKHYIIGKSFKDSLLIGCDFSDCDCQNCDFSNCDLSFASFKDCNLYNCNFENSILYCTVFDTVNLTRSKFDKSYIYGVKFLSFVNITYATFCDLQIEPLRRIGTRYNPQCHKEFQLIGLNQSPSSLIKTDNASYVINGYYIRFQKRDKYDTAREFSQLYNRLKRIHKENFFLNEAAHYYYLERLWYRKSFCKQDLTGNIITSRVKRIKNTLIAYLYEKICGYGEKPLNAIFVAIILWIIFAIIYKLIFAIKYFNDNYSIGDSLKLSALSLFSNQNLGNYDYIICILSLLETFLGIIIFAIFTASIIRKIIRD